jgi:hypothetical protein
VKSIAFNITCPHCRGEMRHITRDDPKGWSTRERRAVVECIKPHCHYTGVVVVELIDLSHKRAVA